MTLVPVWEHPLIRSAFAGSPAEEQRNAKRTRKCMQTSALQLAVLPGSTAGLDVGVLPGRTHARGLTALLASIQCPRRRI